MECLHSKKASIHPKIIRHQQIVTLPSHPIPYIIPYHTIPCQILSHISYHTIPYNAKPYYTIPCHNIPYPSVPFPTISYHNITYHTIQCHAIPYHTLHCHPILPSRLAIVCPVVPCRHAPSWYAPCHCAGIMLCSLPSCPVILHSPAIHPSSPAQPYPHV